MSTTSAPTRVVEEGLARVRATLAVHRHSVTSELDVSGWTRGGDEVVACRLEAVGPDGCRGFLLVEVDPTRRRSRSARVVASSLEGPGDAKVIRTALSPSVLERRFADGFLTLGAGPSNADVSRVHDALGERRGGLLAELEELSRPPGSSPAYLHALDLADAVAEPAGARELELAAVLGLAADLHLGVSHPWALLTNRRRSNLARVAAPIGDRGEALTSLRADLAAAGYAVESELVVETPGLTRVRVVAHLGTSASSPERPERELVVLYDHGDGGPLEVRLSALETLNTLGDRVVDAGTYLSVVGGDGPHKRHAWASTEDYAALAEAVSCVDLPAVRATSHPDDLGPLALALSLDDLGPEHPALVTTAVRALADGAPVEWVLRRYRVGVES